MCSGTKEKELYLHLHINFSNDRNTVFGGHLVRAIISATGEIFIHKIDGQVERKFNEEILTLSVQEQLKRIEKNDKFILDWAKEEFQKGKNITISESCRNNFSLIEKLIYFFRKK